MPRFFLCLVGLLCCTACAKDKRERSPERLDAPWRFEDGEFLKGVQWRRLGRDLREGSKGRIEGAPSSGGKDLREGKGAEGPNSLRAGDAVELHWQASKGFNRGLFWVLLPCSESAWQHYPRVEAPRWFSSRARIWPVRDSKQSLTFELPRSWQERCAALLAFRKKGEEFVALKSGARSPSSDPAVPASAKLAQVALVELESSPPHIDVPFTERSITIDGSDSDWPAESQPRALVHSLNGRSEVAHKTKVRFLWKREALFIFAQLQDKDLWAPDTQRDAPLYRKEALEIFISSDGSATDYLELEFSAANVIFDARFERHRKGERSYDGPWQHAVQLDGTLNNARDRDRGWSVEMALPWAELCAQTRIYCPPLPGSVLRVNVFRLESPRRKAQEGTALSAVYRPDFHAMDRAAFLRLIQ